MSELDPRAAAQIKVVDKAPSPKVEHIPVIQTTRDELAAKAARYLAEARLFDAQAIGQDIDNRTAETLAQSAAIALARENYREEWEAAADHRHRVYQFIDDVDDKSVAVAIDVLNRWARIDKDNSNPWIFVICSTGGNVVEGIKLYTTLKAIATRRPLITVASGMCASMACVLHQAGSERIIEPGTSYLLHDVSGGAAGSITTMQDTMTWLKMMNHRLHIALAEKSNMTVEEIGITCERRDAWFMAEEVVEKGFADRIGYINE